MSVAPASQPASPELACSVEREILRRTWGRVLRLAVAADAGRLVVRGCCPSYYVKQLAILAVLEALGSGDSPPLVVDLQVIAGPST
jgi:hypothetical protein